MFGDQVNRQIRSSQHFELLKYDAVVPMAFSHKASTFAAHSTVKYPKTEYVTFSLSFVLILARGMRCAPDRHNKRILFNLICWNCLRNCELH